MKKKRPTEQIYTNYTTQDFEVWKILFNRQLDLLRPIVSSEYLNALQAVNFTPDKIPDFEEVNSVLYQTTSWCLEVVPNISEQREFFNFLSEKKFTTTCWLRSKAQLDYLEEPDMFHDVFGHVPLLTNKAYVDFFKGISDIALKHIDNPNAIVLLGRIYWFTIEFGLIREDGSLKIYGAGIISSKGETEHCLNGMAKKLSFNIQTIFETDYRTDVFQETYFIIDSFDQLYQSLPTIELLLKENIEVMRVHQ
jgi:phenylalanine-4-hydroxylase